MKKEPQDINIKCINIEPTLRCNLDCTMCPRHYKPELTKSIDIDLDLVKKIVNETHKLDCRKYYLIVGLGEPLLYKGFFDIVKYIKDVEGEVDIVLNTNAITLNENMVERLLSSAITEITFSINTGTQDSYIKMMEKDYYFRVKENIINFLRKRESIKSDVRVFIQYIENSFCDFETFKKEWSSYEGDNVAILYKSILNWAGDINVKEIYKNYSNEIAEERRPCYWLWRDIHIDCNGYVYPCCQGNSHREKSKLCLGSIKDESLCEILNGKKLDKLKELHQ